MATEQLDARQLLAKMEAEEQAAREKAEKLAEENAKKRKELLDKLRADDLADVKAKCELHGFTATDLRGSLKTKGAKKSTPRKSAARKSTGRGRAKKAAA